MLIPVLEECPIDEDHREGLAWGCIAQPLLEVDQAAQRASSTNVLLGSRLGHRASNTTSSSSSSNDYGFNINMTSSTNANSGSGSSSNLNMRSTRKATPARDGIGLVTSLTAAEIPRCRSCQAYINWLTTIPEDQTESGLQWTCALCGLVNNTDVYNASDMFSSRPEFSSQMFQAELTVDRHEGRLYHRPVFFFALDTACSSATLEAMKQGVLAILEALPPTSLIGLLTFEERLGVYALGAASPVVKYAALSDDSDASCAFALHDFFPLDQLLGQLDTDKEAIVRAVSSISPVGGQDMRLAGYSAMPHTDRSQRTRRSLGAAIDLLLTFFEGDSEEEIHARIITFLSDLPDFGMGALRRRWQQEQSSEGVQAQLGQETTTTTTTTVLAGAPGTTPTAARGIPLTSSDAVALAVPASSAPLPDSTATSLLLPQGSFYKELALRAAECKVVCDLFALSDDFVDLATVKDLVCETGGHLRKFASGEFAAMPRDLFRQYGAKHAYHCLARIRTSPSIVVSKVYGHVHLDADQNARIVMPGWDQNKAFAFDLAFLNGTDMAGGLFSSELAGLPVVQLAFAFTVFEHSGHDVTARRYLRVHTIRMNMAHAVDSLLAGVQPGPSVALVAHKACCVAETASLLEARAAVNDYMSALLRNYHELSGSESRSSFGAYPNIQWLQRFVFGLLASNVLATDVRDADARAQAFFNARSASLEFLVPWLYPAFWPCMSFHAFDMGRREMLPLTADALEQDLDLPAVFVFDRGWEVLLLYNAHAAADPTSFPRPPPKDSKFHRDFLARRITRVPVVCCTLDSAEWACRRDSVLLHDAPADVEGKEGMQQWVEHLQSLAERLDKATTATS